MDTKIVKSSLRFIMQIHTNDIYLKLNAKCYAAHFGYNLRRNNTSPRTVLVSVKICGKDATDYIYRT